MKQFSLFAVTMFMVLSLNAQVTPSLTVGKQAQLPSMQMNPEVKMDEMQMRKSELSQVKDPTYHAFKVWYNRPAGAFPVALWLSDGITPVEISQTYCVTPFVDYTYHAFSYGQKGEPTFDWSSREDNEYFIGRDFTTHYDCHERTVVPTLFATDSAGYGASYYLGTFSYDTETYDEPVKPGVKASVYSFPYSQEFLKSSQSFYLHESDFYTSMPLTGAVPYAENEYGWWLGKNGGTGNSARIDGIAQAFEKPTYPYLLNQVVLSTYAYYLKVTAPVEMTCKIYKLDEIPSYQDSAVALLPDVPGELIATGRALVTPETREEAFGMIYFKLYNEQDGQLCEFTPTIDCAILVAIDGYNEPEMSDLVDFTAECSTDNYDEGFGELAYIKYGINDENGNLDHYVWAGLNNFFVTGEKKTGLTIFLSTDNPFLLLNNPVDDGMYLFPDEGGVMEKRLGDVTMRSIEFWSWSPSAEWSLTYNGGAVPDWLHITLTDAMHDGESNFLVNAEVVAEPLPAGVDHREAVVRFGYPGAYVDYRFMQGDNTDGLDEIADGGDVVPVGYYDLTGRQYKEMQPGMNIVKMSDGTAKKVFKK